MFIHTYLIFYLQIESVKMGKSKTKYKVIWENDYKFLSQGPSVYEAKCNECNKVFFIKSGGKADVERHCKTKKHKLLCNKSVGSISNFLPLPWLIMLCNNLLTVKWITYNKQ